MKNMKSIVGLMVILPFLVSCQNKKYTEVVEVPLPTKEEKVLMGNPDDVKANEGAFQIEKLGYSYDALSPTISAFTMENHYSRHYVTYTNNLNKEVAGTDLENLTIEEVLAKLDPSITALRNSAGGYYNHSLYFKCMGPKAGGQPKDTLGSAISSKFGSYDNFSKAFKTEANKLFGSGWVWLVVDKTGQLQITSTQNQDNPLMKNAVVKGKPILALDLWEHAFYLDYQYKRKNYIDGFFDVVDWKKVGRNFEEVISSSE